jgi:ABC transport system ATP-binding/permease protein
VLVDYPSCVLVVTHDRFFLDKIATRLLVFEGEGVVHQHEGGYDLYRRLKEQREAARVEEEQRGRARGTQAAAPARERPVGPRKLSYHEQKELAAMEERILDAEARKAELAERLGDPALYSEAADEVARVTTSFREAEEEVDALYARWAELESIRGG